jgi:hypothetical protein
VDLGVVVERDLDPLSVKPCAVGATPLGIGAVTPSGVDHVVAHVMFGGACASVNVNGPGAIRAAGWLTSEVNAPGRNIEAKPLTASIVTESSANVGVPWTIHSGCSEMNGSNTVMCSCGELGFGSHGSPTPSPSLSRWPGSATNGQSSHASSMPSPSSS